MRLVRVLMSSANWAITNSVRPVSSASRVRMYAEQVPSGRWASRSTPRWVRPRSPLAATSRTAAASSVDSRAVNRGAPSRAG